jgi:hypothetical protein
MYIYDQWSRTCYLFDHENIKYKIDIWLIYFPSICDQSTSGYFFFKGSMPTNEHTYVVHCSYVYIQKQFPSFFLLSRSFTLAVKEKNRRSTVVLERRRQACTYKRYFWTKTCLFSYRPRSFVPSTCLPVDWIDERKKKKNFVGWIKHDEHRCI